MNSEGCQKLLGPLAFRVLFVALPTLPDLFTGLLRAKENSGGPESVIRVCQLKALLTTAPILAFPALDDFLILDTEAINTGRGAILS